MGVFRVFYILQMVPNHASHIGDRLIFVDFNGTAVIKTWTHETKSLKVVDAVT